MRQPKRVPATFPLFFLMFAGILLAGCETERPVKVGAETSLVEHSKIFRQGVEKVADNVYVAIGYGIANAIMIEGKDGLIIVDTMTTNEEAEIVLSEFRKIWNKKRFLAISCG